MAKIRKTQTPDKSLVPGATPTRPPRIGNLQSFLIRENVGWVMAFAKVKRMTFDIEFEDNGTDSRVFDVGGVGSFALVFLTDDPHSVGAKVVDIRPPQDGEK